ncbi:MAG TPA: sugar ABC transporter ATP-binding protein [Spirochaetales bacterium]|nr:sugar ABC transporter ATP-binding protein [Spirochaetales bacterium]HRY55467.1 sugar ABC transporter ATP-binding protein [Spirochaetia bacterium]HRZ63783.1 sugar ABC transporter ATP-binding protein [Spirochaetia bacterium]
MGDVILRAERINKDFGGVPVLKDVDLEVRRGEILGIIGENGAGKSTLMKILSGIYQPSSGRVLVNGEPARIGSPIEARRLGLSLVPQEFNLIRDLPVYDNVFLGAELLTRAGLLDKEAMKARTRELLAQLSVTIDPEARIEAMSAAEKQMVEICKALAFSARVLIMDEPTTMLTKVEIEVLFGLVRKLRAEGMTVIYISHKLKEVKALCDRVVVLRDGEIVHDGPAEGLSVLEMAQRMVGRELGSIFPPKSEPGAEIVFEARGVTVPGSFEDVSFELRKGEILGFAGLVGAGRTEVAEAVLGLRKRTAGEFYKDGKLLRIEEPADAVAAGISYLSEDRQGSGIVTGFSVAQNVTLVSLGDYCRSALRLIDRKRERERVQGYVDSFRIKTESLSKRLENLSGGNQQKVSLAKSIDTEPEVLIVDEPTRGVDVSAKHEIYVFIGELARKGISCVFISSELEEIIGMCNRVVVMRDGKVAGVLEGDGIDEERIMFYATGAHEEVAS